MNSIEINNLTKNYKGFIALDNLNLEIKSGVFGLLGPNGAGKTTLMRTLARILPIQEGTITFNGENILENKKFSVGYLPQHFSAYKRIKVRELLEYICHLKKVPYEQINNEVQRVLEITNLKDFSEKKIKELSGGMIRRVGIAQGILGNPSVLLVDEPTTGLDPEKRADFRNLLNKIGQSIIVIISSHIVEDIEVTCDNLCILKKGHKLFHGNIADLIAEVNGKIYETTIDKEKFHDIDKNIKIIKQSYNGNKVKIRFINTSSELVKNSIMVTPSLEDAYIYKVNI